MRASTSCLVPCLAAAAVCLACDAVPLVAPTESTLSLVATDATVPAGGSTTLTARVVEAAGTPVHDGTVVAFSATLGTVHPAEAPTVRGSASATFTAGQASGIAELRAYSGGAESEPVQVTIGAAALRSVRLTARPGSLPPGGGEATLTALVLDVNQNPLGNVRVAFGTSAGSLRKGVATTGGDGEARTVLRTTSTAEVTASAGRAEATVTVTVDTPTEITITPTPAAPVAGQRVAFALTLVNEARAIRSVTIDFGDGESLDLGAVTAATATHTYREAGVYTVTVTATDVASHVAVSSFVIEVVPAPAIPVTLASAPAEPAAGQPVTFTVTVTPPTGATVRDVTMDFGDGSAAVSLGALSGDGTIAHVYATQGSYIATATATDAAGRRSSASLDVTVAAAPVIAVEITAEPDSSVVDEPVTFTVTVTAGTGAPAVRDVWIDFGDGSDDESLGALLGSRTVAHVYENDGGYIVTVTARDAAGGRSTTSIGITVAAEASSDG